MRLIRVGKTAVKCCENNPPSSQYHIHTRYSIPRASTGRTAAPRGSAG